MVVVPGFQPQSRLSVDDGSTERVPLDAFAIRMVGDTGLEPVTSCMSSKCSNQLS